MSGGLPRLPTSVSVLHALVPELFHTEAALMRAYSYWVPVAGTLEDKVRASRLVYLHMRNADALHQLLGLLRLPPPPRIFSEEAARLGARLTGYASFAELRHAMLQPEALPQRARLQETLGGGTWIFDYYVLETLRDIDRRYAAEILPALSEER